MVDKGWNSLVEGALAVDPGLLFYYEISVELPDRLVNEGIYPRHNGV